MKLICANFKMNLLEEDIINYLDVIENKIDKNNTVFFPSNLYLKHFKDKNYLIGSQDISFKEFGSITGDTSPIQLKEFGITYTLIGHSERRLYFNDSKYISKKIELALKNNLKIVLCIGETLEEFDNQKTFEVLKQELDEALKDNLGNLNDNLIIAYEPIWAIGTGKIPTKDIIENTISFIKNYLKDTYNLNLKVLYGGSVNLENISLLDSISNIDGYLIGGASLDPTTFLALISKVSTY